MNAIRTFEARKLNGLKVRASQVRELRKLENAPSAEDQEKRRRKRKAPGA
jgi:hypothetical protein